MAVNEFEIDQYLDVARERITEQFKTKPVMDRYLQLLLSGKEELQDTLADVMTLRSIDTASGAQLDVIGIIVGLARGLVSSELFTFFGFNGAPQAGSFGSKTDVSVGSPWYSLGEATQISRPPSDKEYRLMLKAKIIKNRTLSRPEDLIAAYQFLFNTQKVTITQNGIASVKIGIGKVLSPIERGLLFNLGGTGTLLPKTVGVEYVYSEFNADRIFATEGFPDGMGIGDLYDDTIGGVLSNLLATGV